MPRYSQLDEEKSGCSSNDRLKLPIARMSTYVNKLGSAIELKQCTPTTNWPQYTHTTVEEAMRQQCGICEGYAISKARLVA